MQRPTDFGIQRGEWSLVPEEIQLIGSQKLMRLSYLPSYQLGAIAAVGNVRFVQNTNVTSNLGCVQP
jgi:hypothetical protein